MMSAELHIPGFSIRRITPDEWDTAAQVWNQAVSHGPVTGEDLRKRDAEQHSWGYTAFTLAVVDREQIAGLASVYQNPGMCRSS